MSGKKYNVLIVSAYPPSRSGGVAQDMMTALEQEGLSVDFFTMYAFKGQKSNQYNIYPEPITDRLKRIKQKYPFLGKFKDIVNLFFKTPEQKAPFVHNHGYRIPHFNEAEPPVDDETLFKSLPDKEYDFIMTYVTERMITTQSFIVLFKKYKVPILIACMDMLHFTGGCYFFGDCRRFSQGCGKCKVLDSEDENDQTHKNYIIKQNVYRTIQYAIICNLYQKQFALECGLYDPKHIFVTSILINEDVFVPNNVDDCRKFFNIDTQKKFIILSRYAPGMDRAKGYDHLARIINRVSDSLSEIELSSVLLVLIGSKETEFSKQLKMDAVSLGVLDLPGLIKSYSAANVFISTSIDDAGPSMVNQSMMCGTPTVTFKIGTALQVTREGINGYSANNFDDEEFANYILNIYRKTDSEYQEMRKNTRQSALEMNSKSANAKRRIEIFEQVKELYKSDNC